MVDCVLFSDAAVRAKPEDHVVLCVLDVLRPLLAETVRIKQLWLRESLHQTETTKMRIM